MTRKEFIGAYNLGYRDGKIEDYCPNDYDDIFDIEQEPTAAEIKLRKIKLQKIRFIIEDKTTASNYKVEQIKGVLNEER